MAHVVVPKQIKRAARCMKLPLTPDPRKGPTTLGLRLVTMESFILLFPIVSCHLNQFEITNETTSTMHGFILKFHSTKFYFVSLVVN
jgi:hypothetical protein